MEIIALDSWEDFEPALRRLETPPQDVDPLASISPLLYRGQSNNAWRLETTLERFGYINMSMVDYFRVMLATKPSIDAFMGNQDDLPAHSDYVAWTANGVPMPGDFKGYSYFAHLRHHSFPSPLLDWSRSPYVAAYFAYANVASGVDQVSIFAYREYGGIGKSHSSGAPYIHHLGPYVRAPKRHFLQQSEYTVCLLASEQRYASHEDAFVSSNSMSTTQDQLWRFDLPATTDNRRRALATLDRFNLNAFSLFASEEGLMQTLAFRELAGRRRD